MTRKDPLLENWLASPLGRWLRRAESRVMADAMSRVFGIQTLQVGLWGEADLFLRHSRTLRNAVAADSDDTGISIRCAPESLPIATHNVDAILLPHTLELASDPHQVLRESSRVLVGDGHMLILGFSRGGLWGMRDRVSRRGYPPDLDRRIPEKQIRDWLSLLSFDVLEVCGYLAAPPLNRQATHRANSINDAGAMRRLRSQINRIWCGAYLVVAQKRTYTMTPVKMRRKARPAVVAGLVEPTTRNICGRS